MREFPLPLANSADYPKPSFFATAQNHLYSAKKYNGGKHSQFLKDGLFIKNGRAAIASVAQSLGLKSGDAILLPEYFCPAMVEPFIWLGLEVRFYQLHKSLEVNHSHLESLIDDKVKACLFVRYFGFSLGIEKSLLLAKRYGLLAIEDCAHSFFSSPIVINSVCFDASICSLNKFFPCIDGGMYRLSCTEQLKRSHKPKGRNIKEEVKYLLNSIGLELVLTKIKGLFFSSAKIEQEKNETTGTSVEKDRFRYFIPSDLLTCCYKLTEWLVKTSNYRKVKRSRVNNYQLLYDGLANSPIGRPLIEPEIGATPYVFPFLLNNSDDFHYIRTNGVQILRWEEFYHSENCEIESYRKKLIQIPCHQNLTKQQITEIISIINKDNISNGK